MSDSHVFVILGDLLHLKCDAWLLPTDARYDIRPHWAKVPGLSEAVESARSPEFSSGEQLAIALKSWPISEPTPVLTAVPLEGVKQAKDIEEAVSAFVVAGAAEAWRRFELQPDVVGRRPRPLLAMPSFGTDGGGGHMLRGSILQTLLETARVAALEAKVDIVLVLRDEKMFALAQVKRKEQQTTYWSGLGGSGLLRDAMDLAVHARNGRLVPFLGAGVSISAGAPSWSRLIEILAGGVELSTEQRSSLMDKSRDSLDQAAFLRAEYIDQRPGGTGEEDGGFAAAIIRAVSLERYGLAPALLASLKSEQAITLNYDELFERASEDAGVPRSVIPGPMNSDADAWLLKLHGSVTDPLSIVLTRDDYLGFNATREALSAIVKATLITHHLMFVGFGLADDHFHQIIHDVRRALPSDGDGTTELATALTLRSDPLNATLWKGRLDIISMATADQSVADAARTLEIFLDALMAFSSDSHSYLLADGYEEALSDPERVLRESLEELVIGTDRAQKETAAWPIIEEMMKRLGATR